VVASIVRFVLPSLEETPDFIGYEWIDEHQPKNAQKEHRDCHSPIEAIHHQQRNEECGSYQRDGSDSAHISISPWRAAVDVVLSKPNPLDFQQATSFKVPICFERRPSILTSLVQKSGAFKIHKDGDQPQYDE
jgi:hypothetical protein